MQSLVECLLIVSLLMSHEEAFIRRGVPGSLNETGGLEPNILFRVLVVGRVSWILFQSWGAA